jgi:hypothetical protein
MRSLLKRRVMAHGKIDRKGWVFCAPVEESWAGTERETDSQ